MIAGYTVAYWIQFESPSLEKTIFISNGGHVVESHGTAMTMYRGNLEYVFRKQNGLEWVVRTGGITPGAWYHIAATW